MKIWIVASYKINNEKKLQENLINQNFKFYLPKIKTIDLNLNTKEEVLFPGYIFVLTSLEQHSKLKYTRGIKNIIQFNKRFAIISDDEISELKKIQRNSYIKPIYEEVLLGQEAILKDGPFKKSLVTIASMPKNDRIDVFIHILGTKRRATVSLAEVRLNT